MRVVADLLTAEARRRRAVQPEGDQFGRSAFNRYYYDAFLRTRVALKTMNGSWSKWPHSEIPRLLRKKAVERVKTFARISRKRGLIHGGEEQRLIRAASTAANELANTLESAYQIRVVADYQPEIQVVLGPNQHSLAGCTSDEARRWVERASLHSSMLLRVYGELGLI